MIPNNKDKTDCLGYEIRRLGVAKHDDIVEALSLIPIHLIDGAKPHEDQPAHLYISVDLAWSEESASDFTVFFAAALDCQTSLWALDYERFQTRSPSVIATRLINFFLKWNARSNKSKKKRDRHIWAESFT